LNCISNNVFKNTDNCKEEGNREKGRTDSNLADEEDDEEEEEEEEVRTRPKTRWMSISFIEEDLEAVAEALKDKNKALKKWHAKLKAEYGTESPEDEEERAKVPKEDDDTEPFDKDKRGGGGGKSRRAKTRSLAAITKMRRTRLRNRLPITTVPELKVVAKSELEVNGMLWRVGDVVRVTQPGGVFALAQIRGFHKDQFCCCYGTLQYLIPLDPEDPQLLVYSSSSTFDITRFIQGTCNSEPVALRDVTYVTRLKAAHLKIKPHEEVQKVVLTGDGKREFLDGGTVSISSIDRPLHQFMH